MRRLIFLPLLLLGFASAIATASNNGRSDGNTSTLGTISALTLSSITVHGASDLTCLIVHRSPKVGDFVSGDQGMAHKLAKLADFAVGDQVRIGCKNGILKRMKHTLHLAGASPSGVSDNSEHSQTKSTASGVGAISGIDTTAGSITVTGDHSLTCTIGASSPAVAAYQVGDHVKIGCVNGVLFAILKLDSTTSPAGNLYGAGTIVALSATSISVTGEHSLTCSIGSSSPGVSTYNIGDRVKLGCQNGVLAGIVKSDSTHTTTTTAATAPTAYTSVTGTLTALSASSISVTGDGTVLTCPIGSSTQSLGDFHVGDSVKMYCANGAFYKLIRPATSNYSYGSGAITTISPDRITVSGDAVLSCTIGATSPSTTGYLIGDRVKMYCQSGALFALVRS